MSPRLGNALTSLEDGPFAGAGAPGVAAEAGSRSDDGDRFIVGTIVGGDAVPGRAR